MAISNVKIESAWLDGFVYEVSGDKFLSTCQDIAKGIQCQNAGLLQLVESLGYLLTDRNPEMREKGTKVLAEVLQRLSEDVLQESELHFVSTFMCDRLKDHNTVVPAALQGILAMANMDNLPKDAAQNIITTIFQHVHCQTHKQTERNTVYKILYVLFQKFENELKRLGPDFAFGVMTMIDGERDPRNLLLVFGMLPHFLKTYSLGHLTEEMFEVLACYFPIDFYSIPSDPDAVTRDDLAASLLPCLVAIPTFAEFCIPLLLEKLTSSLHIAKLDSLQVLQESCKTFRVEDMEKHLKELFSVLHQLSVWETDKEICKEAHKALKELTHMLSTIPVDKTQAANLYSPLQNIISSAHQELGNAQLSLFLPASQMLLTIAHASSSACQLVITEVAPTLFHQYHGSSSLEEKAILLQTLTTFLAVCEEQHVTPTNVPELSSIWLGIPGIYLNAAQSEKFDIRKEGIHGFLVLARSLDYDSRQKVYELLCNYAKQEDSFEVRREVIACLKELALLYPDEIMRDVVFSRLQQNRDPASGDALNALLLTRCMDVLCEIGVVEPFTTCVVPQILSFVTDVFHADKCSIGIKCLRKLIELPDAGPKMNRFLYTQCGAVSQLVSWWLHGICEDEHPEIFRNEQLLIDSAKILSTILRTQSASIQFDVVTEFIPHFVSFDMRDQIRNFSPLNASSPWYHTQSVVLLEALLSPVRQDVDISFLPQLTTELLTLALHTSHPLTSRSSSRLVACLINKACDNEMLSILISDVMIMLTAKLYHNNTVLEEANNAVEMFAWITKSLIMRGHRETDIWVQKLVEMLNSESFGSRVAECFKLIMIDSEEYMNADNYCNIRVFYRQRFFQIVPQLIEQYHQASNLTRSNFLVALAYLLQGVPKVVLNTSLSELIPLLVESLAQKEVILLVSTLEVLCDLLEAKQEVLEDHIATFLPRFLCLTKFMNSLKVRVAALLCVVQICSYPTHLLLPFKQQVIHELEVCLDDPKRLVRQQAVTTRSRWFLIGAPGEPSSS